MAGGRMHTPHFIPLDALLAISLRNYTYFSRLAPLILIFFPKRRTQKPPSPLHTLLILLFNISAY